MKSYLRVFGVACKIALVLAALLFGVYILNLDQKLLDLLYKRRAAD